MNDINAFGPVAQCEICSPVVEKYWRGNKVITYECYNCGTLYKLHGDSWSAEYYIIGGRKQVSKKQISDFKKKLSETDLHKSSVIMPKPHTVKEITGTELYEECYWKFVNSVTYDDAKYWFNQMMTKVTMDLEPQCDYSWLSDPVSSRSISRKTLFTFEYIMSWLTIIVVVIMIITGLVFG